MRFFSLVWLVVLEYEENVLRCSVLPLRFFAPTAFTGHCSRRIFDFSDGSIFWSPLVVSIGELIRGVVDKFLIICFANLQNAVVLVSIDEIFLKFSRIGFLLLLLFVF